MKGQSRRPGIKDVAERAGVSLSSVSRVLDDHPDVSSVMRNRVLDAVMALGYEPDPVAQSMRTGKTMTIGFVAGDTSNPLISQIGLAAELHLKARGYSLLIANSRNDPAQENANIRLLQTRRVDGILISVADESDEGLRSLLSASATPIVLVDREIRGENLAAVYSNHAEGISKAAEHLLSLGHRHVALINGNSRVRPSRDRSAALRKAFADHAGTTVTVLNGSFSDQHGYDAVQTIVRKHPKVTAVVSGSNQILVGVLRAVRDLQLRIPQQLSLVTCDETPLAELYQPRIATINRDATEMGTAVAELLLEQIGDGERKQVRLGTRYEPAESCAIPQQ